MFEELLVRKGPDNRPSWTMTDGFLLLALARFLSDRGDSDNMMMRPSTRDWQKSIRPWLEPRGDFEHQMAGELFIPRWSRHNYSEICVRHSDWLPSFHVQSHGDRSLKDVWLQADCYKNPITRATGYIKVSGFVHGGQVQPLGKLEGERAEEALLKTVGMAMLRRSDGQGGYEADMSFIAVPHTFFTEHLSDSLYMRCLGAGIYMLLARADSFLVLGGSNHYVSARWL